MRPIIVLAVAVAVLSGCETTPESIRQTTEPFHVTGNGKRQEVAACVLRKGEPMLRAVGALRPDIEPGVTELVWSSEACLGACSLAQVREVADGRLDVAYWLAGDLFFRGTFSKNMGAMIEGCLAPKEGTI